MPNEMKPCAACGMMCHSGEYHPYLACLAFKACKDGDTVRANIEAVVEYGAKLGRGQIDAE